MTSQNDPLFAERLDIFMEKCLTEIREFAQRERRSFEQVRELVVNWHWRHMLDSAGSLPNEKVRVKGILESTSKQLNSLLRVAGRHSLLLVVDPEDDGDDSFLGGTNTGREFWMGMRNGGVTGVRHFKQFCKDNRASNPACSISTPEGATDRTHDVSKNQPITVGKSSPAVMLKNQLYVEMRNALRSACGIRNAEMKWSKPGKLSIYGVSLVGWPREVEYKNPSRMSSQEMSTILSLLRQGTLYFESERDRSGSPAATKAGTPPSTEALAGSSTHAGGSLCNDTETDISWAYNDVEHESIDNGGSG